MNATVSAQLVMELNVSCPFCDHHFDLFKTEKNDEGYYYGKVLDDARWAIPASERLHDHVHCPECSAEFEVKGVEW